MGKNLTKMISIFVILSSFVMLTAYGKEISIDRRYEYQQKSNWCWAANAKNLVIGENSYGNTPTITQSQAVHYVLDQYGDKITDYNIQGTLGEVAEAAEYISEENYGYQPVTSPFSFTNLYNLVNSLNSPAYMSIQDKKNYEGHSILMYGANNSNRTLLIFDPATGSQGGNKRIDYDDLVDGIAAGYKGFVYDSTVYCTAHY